MDICMYVSMYVINEPRSRRTVSKLTIRRISYHHSTLQLEIGREQ